MSRLGKSMITDTELLTLDRIIAEIDAVDAGELASWQRCCSPRRRCRRAASAPNEDRFLAAVEQVHPGLPAQAAA